MKSAPVSPDAPLPALRRNLSLAVGGAVGKELLHGGCGTPLTAQDLQVLSFTAPGPVARGCLSSAHEQTWTPESRRWPGRRKGESAP